MTSQVAMNLWPCRLCIYLPMGPIDCGMFVPYMRDMSVEFTVTRCTDRCKMTRVVV